MVDPQTIIEAKRTLGRQLAALREAAGKTQDQLAKQIKYGRSTIANAETGYSTCRRTFWEHADRALHANGSLLAGYDELQTLTRQRHADHAHLMGQRRTAAFRKIQDQQESDDQRPPLMSVTPSAARSTHWSASSGDNAPTALLSPDVEPPADHRRRVGEGTVRDLAARVHRFRLADDILAGGDLVVPAIRDLRAAVRLYRQSSHTDVVGRGLLARVGELAQIAGWIASDAGMHDVAERVYSLGISAAQEAKDPTLAGNLVGSLAYQHANRGRERDGVDLARRALDEAGPEAPARVRALFLDRLAWACAPAGDVQAAIRALGDAHEALSSDDGDAPQWAYWVSQDELDVMDARVFAEIHRPLRAVPLLSKVLDRYDATHAREMALYLSWLAVAYADANEPEAAASAAGRMLDLSEDLASARTAERARVVVHRLMGFAEVPEVRVLLRERALA